MANNCNGRDSFQLFVGVLDKCPVWYLLVLPSETHAVANMTSLRAIDGNTSYHSRESFSLWKATSHRAKVRRAAARRLTHSRPAAALTRVKAIQVSSFQLLRISRAAVQSRARRRCFHEITSLHYATSWREAAKFANLGVNKV